MTLTEPFVRHYTASLKFLATLPRNHPKLLAFFNNVFKDRAVVSGVTLADEEFNVLVKEVNRRLAGLTDADVLAGTCLVSCLQFHDYDATPDHTIEVVRAEKRPEGDATIRTVYMLGGLDKIVIRMAGTTKEYWRDRVTGDEVLVRERA